MIQGFSDYEKTEVNSFEGREKVKLGGHICKVLEVSTETVTSKKDAKVYNILKMKFDIDEPDEQAGFYQRRFKEDANKDAINAKWKGYYNLTIPDNTSADFVKQNWKAFLTSIEKSNLGVQINGSAGFDENILVGKKFGGIFGLEEFTLPDGKTITFTRIRFARSTENIKDAQIPSVRLLDGSYVKYEEYVANKSNGNNNSDSNNDITTETGTINPNDDLPF